MSDSVFKAMVVDDDLIVRKMLAFALKNEGFRCVSAVDGADALAKLSAESVDLVVTDLCMPNKHGHALSVELLARHSASILVVHTSVDDPSLAKDLMSRGVDDIIYKPTNYGAFAAKMKILVERRRKAKRDAVATVSADLGDDSHEPSPCGAADDGRDGRKISIAELESRLSTVWNILPLSRATIVLVEEVRKNEATVSAIAGIIQRDAALTADVLRLANSAFFKGTSHAILDVEEAVTRIGMRRLGELAVAMNAMGALSKSVLPWFDKELASQRSLAGGIAVSRLLDATGHKIVEDGMVLAAVMYPLGRVILGVLFPRLYGRLVATSRAKLIALRQLERTVFPEPHSAATARVLAHGGLPKEVYGLLAYTGQSFGSLSSLPEPSHSHAYLVKTGILLGRLAVGRWLPEDSIDFPSVSKLGNLRLDSFDELVDQVRNDLQTVAPNDSPGSHRATNSERKPNADASRKLRYCNLSPEPVDFLRLLLTSMGYELEDVPSEVRDFGDPLVINCTRAPATRLAAKRGPAAGRPWVIVVDNELPASFQDWGEIVRLPASYGALRAACDKIAEAHCGPNAAAPPVAKA